MSNPNPKTDHLTTGTKGPGTRVGSRQKMTQEMLTQASQLMALGKQPIEILYEWFQRDDIPLDIRQKSLFKYMDLIYPKAASVEVKMEEVKPKDTDTVDRLIKEKLEKLGIVDEGAEVEKENEDEAE